MPQPIYAAAAELRHATPLKIAEPRHASHARAAADVQAAGEPAGHYHERPAPLIWRGRLMLSHYATCSRYADAATRYAYYHAASALAASICATPRHADSGRRAVSSASATPPD